jgi:predicted RNase H-like HicB family nuclease
MPRRFGARKSRIGAPDFERLPRGRDGRFAIMPSEGDRARYCVAVHRAMGGYVATVADLPGCHARGASEVEAVENARAAIRAWREMSSALAECAATVRLEIVA